jgi:hypothetical protein
MEIAVNDVVRLRKKHPCGGDEWRVMKLGVDIRIQCLKCHRLVLLERGTLERRIKDFISKTQSGDSHDAR